MAQHLQSFTELVPILINYTEIQSHFFHCVGHQNCCLSYRMFSLPDSVTIFFNKMRLNLVNLVKILKYDLLK
jgi:hypothetical protein